MLEGKVSNKDNEKSHTSVPIIQHKTISDMPRHVSQVSDQQPEKVDDLC